MMSHRCHIVSMLRWSQNATIIKWRPMNRKLLLNRQKYESKKIPYSAKPIFSNYDNLPTIYYYYSTRSEHFRKFNMAPIKSGSRKLKNYIYAFRPQRNTIPMTNPMLLRVHQPNGLIWIFSNQFGFGSRKFKVAAAKLQLLIISAYK